MVRTLGFAVKGLVGTIIFSLIISLLVALLLLSFTKNYSDYPEAYKYGLLYTGGFCLFVWIIWATGRVSLVKCVAQKLSIGLELYLEGEELYGAHAYENGKELYSSPEEFRLELARRKAYFLCRGYKAVRISRIETPTCIRSISLEDAILYALKFNGGRPLLIAEIEELVNGSREEVETALENIEREDKILRVTVGEYTVYTIPN